MKNRSLLRQVAAVTLAGFVLTSCATLPPAGTALTPEERDQAKRQCITNYTAAGAIGGAVVGLLVSKRKAEGALLGAAAGGVLAMALAWGHCLALYSDIRSYPAADAREIASRTGYRDTQGFVVKIDDFRLNPSGIAPGGSCRVEGSYYVMAPEGKREVKVKETRTVFFYDTSADSWKELGSVDQEVTAALGGRRAEGNFDLPSDVPEGRYRVVFTVTSSGVTDEAAQELTVKKGLAMRPAPQAPGASGYDDQVASTMAAPGSKSVEKRNPAASGGTDRVVAEVTSKRLNLRSGPKSSASIITVLKKGEVYEVRSEEGEGRDAWAKLRLDDGTEGWAQLRFLKVRR